MEPTAEVKLPARMTYKDIVIKTCGMVEQTVRAGTIPMEDAQNFALSLVDHCEFPLTMLSDEEIASMPLEMYVRSVFTGRRGGIEARRSEYARDKLDYDAACHDRSEFAKNQVAQMRRDHAEVFAQMKGTYGPFFEMLGAETQVAEARDRLANIASSRQVLYPNDQSPDDSEMDNERGFLDVDLPNVFFGQQLLQTLENLPV